MIRRALVLFIVLLVSVCPSRAQKRAFTIEDLYRVKNLSDLNISPDGKTIVFAATTSDLARAKRTSHVWAMDIDGRNPRMLTVGDTSEYSPTVSPDGKQILFISSKGGSANLYLIPASGGEWRMLTKLS